MLRSMLNKDRNVASKIVEIVRCTSLHRYSQNSEPNKVHKETLGVTLCGQISEAPTKTENGTVVVPLITRHGPDEFRTKHQVCISPSILKEMPVDRLIEGARIYVTGVIYYLPFISAEGRRARQGKILPTNIIPCEENTDLTSDINDVILYGRVVNPPAITENVTFLLVETKFYDSKERRYRRNFHDLMVKDDDEMRERANRLTAGVSTVVHGFLRMQQLRNEEGKYRGKYFVLPRRLIACQVNPKTFRMTSD